MWIKINENGDIINHDYHQHDDFNTEVSENILVDLQGPYFGVYRFKYIEGQLVALTDEEKKSHPVRIANKMAEIRQERNRLLAETDYLLASDYPISAEDKLAVIAYRTALRDLPANVTDVDSVTWPQR